MATVEAMPSVDVVEGVAPAPPPCDVRLTLPDLYEVLDGKIVEKPIGIQEAWLGSLLVDLLASHARGRGLGRVLGEALFDLRHARPQCRRPDVAFVSFARWPRERRLPPTNAWAVVPELAVEIVSPTNTATEVEEKLADYFAAGVARVWIVHPHLGRLYDYTTPTRVTILTRADILDGGDVLPGLRLPLAELFEDVGEEESAAPAPPAGV